MRKETEEEQGVRRQITVFSAGTLLRQRSSSARFSSARANKNCVRRREPIVRSEIDLEEGAHIIVTEAAASAAQRIRR